MAVIVDLVSFYSLVSTNVPGWTLDRPDSRSTTQRGQDQYGGLTNNLPISSHPAAINGQLQASFYDMFYERLHFIPGELKLGNVASAQSREIVVWNAFLSDKSFTAFNMLNTEGLTVTQPIIPPFNFKPLQVFTYDVGVTLDGPAVVDAIFRWTIDGTNYDVPVTGNRVSPYFYRHNWNAKFKETWSYKTSVVRRKDSTEQRARLRIKPRKTVSFTSLISGEEFAVLNNTLFGWQSRIFAVPIWSDVTKISVEAAAGTNTLSLAETSLSFFAGTLVALWNGSNYEMIEIEAINGATITLTNNLVQTWPINTSIVPLNSARLNTQQPIIQYTDDKAKVASQFECDPVSTETGFDGASAPLSYNGSELWIKKINWKSPRSNSTLALIDTVDAGTGAIKTNELQDFNSQVKSYAYLLSGREDIKAFKEFIERRKGKCNPCYVPTWDKDFVLVSTISSSDSVIDVKDNNYRNFVEAHNARNHIYIELKDGSYLTRKIDATNDNGNGTQRLSLDSPIGTEINPEDIRRFCVLLYARLVSDTIEYTYHSTETCEVHLTFVSLKER